MKASMRSRFSLMSSEKAHWMAATLTVLISSSHARLLLGDAMERAATGYNMAGGQTHRAPARESLFDGLERGVVRRRAVERHHDGGIADVEVHRTGGDDLAVLVLDTPRRGHGDDL